MLIPTTKHVSYLNIVRILFTDPINLNIIRASLYSVCHCHPDYAKAVVAVKNAADQ
ncbi:hypothetical protein ACFRH9_16035 [Peribacillus butanolivorans]|uniref:hypothetical protein n=1 Tax=Peribacillus butanolivorans TaxID=421767 RepID=UPI00366A6143